MFQGLLLVIAIMTDGGEKCSGKLAVEFQSWSVNEKRSKDVVTLSYKHTNWASNFSSV